MNQQPKFLMIHESLLSSTKLNLSQKALIAYILGWQANDKICFQTNTKIGEALGLKKSGAISLIRSLKTFEFFTSIQVSTTGHQLIIDSDKLNEFLSVSTDTKPVKKEQPKLEPTAPIVDPAPIVKPPVDDSDLDATDTIENLIKFSDLYNKEVFLKNDSSAPSGRVYIINMLINRGDVKTPNEVIKEYQKYYEPIITINN